MKNCGHTDWLFEFVSRDLILLNVMNYPKSGSWSLLILDNVSQEEVRRD
jgi:hypothetical protein